MSRRWTPVWTLLLATAAFAVEDPSALAKRLASLRADVEQMHADLDAEREGVKAAARAFESRKTDLEAEIRAQQLRTEGLSRQLARLRAEASERTDAHQALAPVVPVAVAALRQAVDQGLPFRTDERKAALDQIEEQVQAGALDPRLALTRLWQHVEDELRLTRENTLDRMTIEVDGARRHVQVARLGMVAMFYLAEDEATGRWVREGEGGAGRWETLSDPEQHEQILAIFAAFDKQGRSGWFEMPWALASGGAR